MQRGCRLLQSELSSSVPRRDGDAVRFFDDMDMSDRHLHSLHQSISDLNNGQQRLRQELEEERLRRTRFVSILVQTPQKTASVVHF